ncbi:hypothetical protein [Ramlibacter sp. PS4R-6]|uniref:hypothetical protein n=1 Tax=Ramlibacter sp. PS4R-6 TaxID=3133438 RepID=UPI0030B20B71
MKHSKALPFGPPVGKWTHEHWTGAVVVFALAAGIALQFWPGWDRLHGWLQ